MNSKKRSKKKQKTNELKPKQYPNQVKESKHLLSLSDQIEAFADVLSSHILKSLYETDTD
jgi:hypothetical protein